MILVCSLWIGAGLKKGYFCLQPKRELAFDLQSSQRDTTCDVPKRSSYKLKLASLVSLLNQRSLCGASGVSVVLKHPITPLRFGSSEGISCNWMTTAKSDLSVVIFCL